MPRTADRWLTPEGGEARFRELFESHGGEVHRFFVRKRFSFEDSRDLTQETFVRVYQGLSEFRGDAAIRTWIFSIARHLFLNARRHETADKRTHSEVPLDAPLPVGGERSGPGRAYADPAAADPLEAALAAERRELLRRAIAELPDRMRQCVLLRVFQDRKYREIADLLDVTIDTVKSHLHQAKGRLREILGERFEGLDRLDEGGNP